MSRTRRNPHYLRKPKTQKERKQLQSILDDLEETDYSISGLNHVLDRLSNLPHANDDKVISAYYQ